MADSNTQAENAASGTKPDTKPDAKLPKAKPNPIYKYMGLGENFRPKLPSRNWMIFLTITGSFTAAVVYDKREKRRVQRKWCKLVEHIAKEPLDSRAMPRKLTVFLEGPPSDGLRSAQDHFKEYVKPILVASGLDWEFIQGRKEGDIRAELAQRIRKSRTPPEERGEEEPILEVRKKAGITEFDGPRGDIVIGRHTWKEYVRGIHEGWLGPLTEPPKPSEDTTPEESKSSTSIPDTSSESPLENLTEKTDSSTSDAGAAESTPETKEPPKEEEKPKKPPQLSPFISVLEYQSAPTLPELPAEFDPSTPISFPHILGFLNTPRRLYRFLNRRKVADSIGRETAAIILSTYRPYHATSIAELPTSFAADDADNSLQADSEAESIPQTAEQQIALTEEEKEWHKSVRERKEGEPERTWLEPVVLDPRIASRMRRFELTAEDEERAKSIVVPEEEIEGWIKGGIRSLGREGLKYIGFRKEKKPVYEETEEGLE
ncbi:hypothetical protein G7Y89_g5578 [Cudoniella acicularis]|uniref:Mitochondrial import inner membrane translocase subunit TIM54 n=1 Tax=Cudoniella acicularis TaxID=354080 RepID=A0A8H4W6D0_9HELO|nr:hypothetical protein G7Y89_g5578 [Cudoniella acicularis]